MADIVFLSLVLGLYFRLFDFRFTPAPGQLPSLEFAPFKLVAARVCAVIAPIVTQWFASAEFWLSQLLGFIGLIVLLGPATIRLSAAKVVRASENSILSKVGAWLVDGIKDKIVGIQLALFAYLLISVFSLFGITIPVEKIIPHPPYFPNGEFALDKRTLSRTAGVVIVVSLYLKTLIIPRNYMTEFIRPSLIFVFSAILVGQILSIMVQYTHFTRLDHLTALAWVMSIILHKP